MLILRRFKPFSLLYLYQHLTGLPLQYTYQFTPSFAGSSLMNLPVSLLQYLARRYIFPLSLSQYSPQYPWNCQESCSLKNTQNSLSIIVQFADCNRCNCSSHIFGILSSSPQALVLSLTIFRKCVYSSSAIAIGITPRSLSVAFHTIPDILQAITHPDQPY